MLKLIKNGQVYAPEYLGVKDLLLIGSKIGHIEDRITVPNNFVNIEVIDAKGKIVVPGFIDSHVHITGGGGEGSYKTRTPELQLSDATLSGVTTIVGVIGTDGTTRTMTNLVAKARALSEEGITCYAHTGSYQVPVKTLTGSIEDDIILIDLIIGCGEIAIADHRSSQPTVEEFARLASQARVGGMLSGKAGVINVHVGGGESCLSLLEEVVNTTDIPIKQFHPTHINRNERLLEAGLQYAKKGGYVDFTTSTIPKGLDTSTVKSSKALKRMLAEGVSIDQVTFTSDAQGSLPDFDEQGNFIGLKVAKINSLFEEVRDAIIQEHIPIEQAIQVVTKNPAAILKLSQKGQIKTGLDADVVLLDENLLNIDTVIAKGQVMVQNGKAVVKGTFE
ncbi:beta-aspartyl-dipeptidase (metallo-type) [Salirhabdus euzebyi]|uniref:Isoaspartyl dipeptidase n=1 Tax=Salirhabdus euzebyi TaxID=394506 RepID=A0A841Q9A7_9BACI|nr:beta-aspartyl-peptidase [Salirhabdus euzebyi]MBB6454955.1 beta-aspartyl-dipeptidase (metallo-type) [Salirhabdus euzebyi]